MALETRSSAILRFGVFEVDVRAGELRKQGVRVKLQEQPFQVLTVLLQCAGEVVTREELRNQNWPPDTFVDFDNSLNTAINKLREALGDSADSPKYIETLPRRGYRFIGSVEEVQAPWIVPEKSKSKTDPPPARIARRPEFGSGFLITLVACLALGFAIWMTWQHFYAKSPVPAIHSL